MKIDDIVYLTEDLVLQNGETRIVIEKGKSLKVTDCSYCGNDSKFCATIDGLSIQSIDKKIVSNRVSR